MQAFDRLHTKRQALWRDRAEQILAVLIGRYPPGKFPKSLVLYVGSTFTAHVRFYGGGEPEVILTAWLIGDSEVMIQHGGSENQFIVSPGKIDFGGKLERGKA